MPQLIMTLARWGFGYLIADKAVEALEESGQITNEAANLTKWVIVGGVLYYGGKAVGVIK